MKKIFTLLSAAALAATASAAIDTVPESAEIQTWYFNAQVHWPTENVINKEIQVAIDGNDLYFTGISPDFHTWVKGALEDGLYVFAQDQDMGMFWGYPVSFAGYDYDNWTPIVATAQMSEDVLTFNTAIGFYYNEAPDNTISGIGWEIGATMSKEPVEFVEPVLNENTATLPYKNNFDSEAKRAQVAMHPNDETGWLWGANWETGDWYATCNNDGWEQANDYLIFPGLPLEAGKNYVLGFDNQSSSSSYWQYYEVLMAPEAKLSKFTEKLIENGMCYNYDWQSVEKEFTVAETGTYYIAIHCTSYAYNGYFTVDNFVVEEQDSDKPMAVETVNVTPGRNGALTATINFTMPSANIGGQTYDSDKELNYKVTRGDIIIAEGVDKAGAMVFVNDDGMGLTNGTVTYTVVVADGAHQSKEAEGSAYIGVDYPTETEYMEISVENGMVTIAWVPVTRGANGGYVGAKYNVYSCSGRYQRGEKLNDEPLSECVFTFAYDVESGEQGEAWFCVTAVNDLDESYGNFASIEVGAPYELPFTESFANDSLIWNYDGNGGGVYADRWGSFSSDGDDASLCFYIWGWEVESSDATATSGKIKPAANATLTLDYWAQTATQLTVKLCNSDGSMLTVGTYDFAAGAVDSLVIANLFDQVADKPYVKLCFEVKMDATYQYFFIDNLKIEAETGSEVLLPAVTMDPTEINATSIKLTFTPNEATGTYYCCQFDAGTLEEQFNMWSAWMGFQTPSDMVKAWGLARQGVQTVEWNNLTPSTSYDIYVLPVDAEGNYGELQCFPVTTSAQGGEGASVITIEIGEFGGDETTGYWQIVTYTPNDQTNVFYDLICTEAFYQENGAEGVKAYLMDEADPSNPYSSYYTQTGVDVAKWNAEPGTTYHACAIGKNANGEWGEMTDVVFTTPGVSSIQVVETAEIETPRYNLQGLQTTNKKGLTIQNGRVIYNK